MQRHDVYEGITDQVIAAIEKGAGEWQMPWHRSAVSRPLNAHTKKSYRGVNVVALWAAADACGYSSGYWATYKQWQELGAQVRKGERASLIVFWKELEREEEETGERGHKKTVFARASWVFNVDQVDVSKPPPAPKRNLVEALDQAEALTVAAGAQIHHGGDNAYYQRSDDYILIPKCERFIGSATSTPTETYYATLLHELTHWTGHEAGSIAISQAASAMRHMRWKSSWPNSVRPFSVRISRSRIRLAPIMPPTSPTGLRS